MKKQVLRTVLATAMAFTVAAMPALTVCAEDLDVNPDGSTIDVSYGDTLGENYGTVSNNYGTIIENTDSGTVQWTSSRSVIETNNGYVNFQTGTINTNNGRVEGNYNPSSTIEMNNGIVNYNSGKINYNNGRVINNLDSGEILDGTSAENQWWSVSFGGAYDSMQLSPEFDDNSDWGGPAVNSHYLKEADGEEGILVLRAADGYRVTTGSGEEQLPTTCQCTARQDGNNYVITVSSIIGYTNLSLQMFNLIVEAIQQSSGETASGGTVTVVVDDSVSIASDNRNSESSDSLFQPATYATIPAGAITISLPRTTAATAVAAAGPAVLGANREAARTASFKMAQLTDAQYKDAVISNISATPAGGLFRVETDRIATFDRTMLEAFAKKGNVDLEVLFPLGGKMFSVMIPAGTDINKLLDDKGYCGFLRLLSILGGEIVTK